jgi:hypothetical protein
VLRQQTVSLFQALGNFHRLEENGFLVDDRVVGFDDQSRQRSEFVRAGKNIHGFL